jgi:SAM-dependent methyltransferase
MGWVQNVFRQVTPPIIWNSATVAVRLCSKSAGPPGGGEREKEWYEQLYASKADYSAHYTHSQYYFLWCVLADRITRRGVRSILDIGCGPGQFAACLRDRGIGRYCGIDLSETAVAMARKVCPEFQFVAADIFECDLIEAAQYDAAVSLEFLEHVERDLDVLGRIPQGKPVFATVPNFPYVSHVRHFKSTGEVYERYRPLISDLRVDAFRADDRGKTFYMLEGIRH